MLIFDGFGCVNSIPLCIVFFGTQAWLPKRLLRVIEVVRVMIVQRVYRYAIQNSIE